MNSAPRTILVVDDNPSVLQILRHVLSAHGFSVVTAAGGAEALRLAKEQTMSGALIDVHMPGMNGIELCRALRKHGTASGGPTPVWLMTGAATAEVQKQTAEAGALAVLGKPFDMTELVERLNEQLGGVASTVPTNDEVRT